MPATYQDGYIKWVRSHIGNEMIYLVYTTAFVFDENNHLLVQERYDFDWLSVPGGALEPHESLLECVQRETHEETGVHCTVERFVGVFSHPQYNLLYPNGDQVQPWTAAFACRSYNSDTHVDGKETLKAAFRPVEEVRHRLPLMYQHMLEAIEKHPSRPNLEPIYHQPELRPYYPILREKVGTERIILPGGTAVIFNELSDVLAVHDKKRDLWDLPAGFADLGESSTGTIVREMLEETGLKIEPTQVFGIYSHPSLTHIQLQNGDKIHLVDLILESRIVSGELHPDNFEIDGICFMSIEALAAQSHNTPLRKQLYADLLRREQAPFIR